MASSTAVALRERQDIEPQRAGALEARSQALAAEATSAVQAQALLAKQFPRDEDQAMQKIARACKRPVLADKAAYSYPRGGTQVKGPSINLLRAIAGYWGNIVYGYQVVGETPEGALIRGFAWDLESNVKSERDHFVERKVLRSNNRWEVPDLRDWREWLGNIGSRYERRALENVIPRDVVDQADEWCAETRTNEYAKDPDQARRKILAAFDEINVPAVELERFLGCPVKQASPSQIDTLRGVYRAISDGAKTWRDYLPAQEPAGGSIDPSKLRKSEDPNRGHGNEAPAAATDSSTAEPPAPKGPNASLDDFTGRDLELVQAFARSQGHETDEQIREYVSKWDDGATLLDMARELAKQDEPEPPAEEPKAKKGRKGEPRDGELWN